MAEKMVSDPHKATIKRHMEESMAAGVPLDQVHRELLEVFGSAYSMQQINGVTSWLRSNILGKKRVNEIDWDENAGQTNEDVNFDNVEKNDSRAWHFSNIAKHTMADQRRVMRVSLLPGKNRYDFEAAKAIGLECRNLVTYILGEDPKSTAEYIRTCRAYGVVDRRIGNMTDLLDAEDRPIHAAYWDYFGQLCPAYVENTMQMQFEPDYGPIPLGFNVLKGREHGSTQHLIADRQARQQLLKETQGTNHFGMAERAAILYGAMEVERAIDFDIADVRDDIAQNFLFARVGTANVKNWLLLDEARKLIDTEMAFKKKRKRYDSMTNLERLAVFEQVMQKVSFSIADMDDEGLFRREGIYGFALAGSGAAMAMVNRPIVLGLETPKEYKSPHKNRPFVSYFGTVETRRRHYMNHVEGMKFLLDVMNVMLPVVNAYIDQNSNADIDYSQAGTFRCRGSGAAKEILFVDPQNRVVAHINHDKFLEANFAFSIAKENFHDGKMRILQPSYATIKEGMLRESHAEGAPLAELSWMQSGPIRNSVQRIGRNSPCSCGSGKKFKKCCMRC